MKEVDFSQKDVMLNDWVYEGSMCKPIQVSGIDDDGVYYKWDNIDYHILPEDLNPIPLTAEMLKQNGFRDCDEIFDYRWTEEGCSEKLCFYLRKMYDSNHRQDSWGSSACGVLPIIIQYVHELQQALRIVGLKDLANNFKITI